jgi:MFS family permease
MPSGQITSLNTLILQDVIGYYQVVMYEKLRFTSGVGRKKPLFFGTVGITLVLICEGVIKSQSLGGTKKHLSIASLAFLVIVSIIFSLSFGPVSWVYISEIMPVKIRARGNAFAAGIGDWLVAAFWAQASPIALEHIGRKFYFLFVAFNIYVTFQVIFFFFKEATQVSLEDIDLFFGERALGTLSEDLSKGIAVQTLGKTDAEAETAESAENKV